MSVGHASYFDDASTMAMCIAFDRACKSLQAFGHATTVQEVIATQIIKAAAQGERDPDRLHYEALKAFDIEETPKTHSA